MTEAKDSNRNPDDPHQFSEYKTSNGYTLATYTWLPECGIDKAKGCVFLMHGVFAHVRFEYLEPDAENHRVIYTDSIPAHLNSMGLIVVGHDHPAHGRSSGLRGYVDSMDDLRDAAVDFIDYTLARDDLELTGKPRFLAGMSLGATVAIGVSRLRPDRFTGYILFSPAVRTPDDMFGWYGKFLKAVSSVLAIMAPKLRVLRLPPSPVEEIRDAVQKDALVQKDPMRVRLAMEFLRIYSDIEQNVSSISFPAVLVFVGGRDPIVSKAGILEFCERIQSDDKHVEVMNELGHEVLREPGCERTRRQIYKWIGERL